jgi:hypothetical protein
VLELGHGEVNIKVSEENIDIAQTLKGRLKIKKNK